MLGSLPAMQSAYCHHHSMETALTGVVSDILMAADNGCVYLSTFRFICCLRHGGSLYYASSPASESQYFPFSTHFKTLGSKANYNRDLGGMSQWRNHYNGLCSTRYSIRFSTESSALPFICIRHTLYRSRSWVPMSMLFWRHPALFPSQAWRNNCSGWSSLVMVRLSQEIENRDFLWYRKPCFFILNRQFFKMKIYTPPNSFTKNTHSLTL